MVLEIVATYVADHIMLQVVLSSDAPLSVAFRHGPPLTGTPGFIWSIHGEQKQINITAAAPALQANDDKTNIAVQDFLQETLGLIEWDHPLKDLPQMCRQFMRHRHIEEVYGSAEDGRRAFT